MLSTALTLLRIAVLIFSFYGLFQFTLTKLSVNVDFVIPIVFASVGSVLFLSGILRILPAVAVLILLGGVYLGIRSIISRENFFGVVSAGTVFFAAISVFLAFIIYGAKVVAYDDFSHWAIVMRPLVNSNRFPNSSDYGISFASYPLGSASFIYYFSFVTGIKAEWMYMYSKAVLTAGMFTSLFAFSRKWPTYILAGAAEVMLFAGNNAFHSLLVDTLLPVVGAAGFLFCVFYREEMLGRIWYTLPFTVFLMTIKNSGIFFTLAILGYMLLCGHGTIKENRKKWIINTAAPFAVLLLWQLHVKLTFNNGLRTKHSMSLYYYGSTLLQKSFTDIRKIIKRILLKFFSTSNRIIYILVFVLILYAVLRFLFKKRRDPQTNTDLYMLLTLFAYELGIIGTFIFSMPRQEALGLSSYSRYYNTGLIFIAAYVCARTIAFIDRLDRTALSRTVSGAAVVLCILSVYYTVKPNFDFYQKQVPGGLRFDMERIIEEYDLPSDKKYLLSRTGPDNGKLEFPFHYLLEPEVAGSATSEWMSENPECITDFDYLIVFERDEAMDAYLEETFGSADVEVVDFSEYR